MDADDGNHEACLQLLETHPGPLLVPILCVTEAACLVGTHLGPDAEVRLLGDFARGALICESVEAGDWLRIAELVWHYRDLRLGTVDASVVATAERLVISSIATLDRRHFNVVDQTTRPHSSYCRDEPRVSLLQRRLNAAADDGHSAQFSESAGDVQFSSDIGRRAGFESLVNRLTRETGRRGDRQGRSRH